ncbi:hypothetical protein AMK27_39630 [Streptomyces sp. CB02009]|uniref:hypothetical protein n=1 Tax=Streptomyces sp. CB02009 TaxID=1703938 RepID=UPI00093AB46B|nr:hypothetical protein [Streptomyces sp. CB02009]OKJ46892.1 hypothetical protein AMK27_39630 [Streptomyces sp. CB02009]
MTLIEGTARPTARPKPPVPVLASEAAPTASRLTRGLQAVTVGTGLLCGLAAAYLGVTGQTGAAAIVGGVAAAAFAALGGITVTIHIRK